MIHRDVEIYRAILDWQSQGIDTAVATVLSTWGSAPRAVGSILAVNSDGSFVGSVSGGCVESAVVRQSIEAMRLGRSREVSFGVTDDEAFDVGLACGGTIRVLIEPLSPSDRFAEECAHALETRRLSVLVRLLGRDSHGDMEISRRWTDAADFEPYKGSRLDGDMHFIQPFLPRPRIFIVGGVHIAQALVSFAEILDFEPIIVDPREAWANPQRFPNVRIIAAWPDEAFHDKTLDRGSAVVALTHDAKFDDPALICALQSDAFYVGALGGRHTNQKRSGRFRELGMADELIQRLHAPIGLNIGAANPQEIALAIMAEIVARWRNK